MPLEGILRAHVKHLIAGGVIFLVGVIAPLTFASFSLTRFNRYEVRQNERSTHFVFKLSETPDVVLSRLPDRRIRLVLRGCEPGFIRSIARYRDARVRQVTFMSRMNDLVLTFTLADPETGVRMHREEGTGVITLDIGTDYRVAQGTGILPSRETIRSGVERLIREYDPPLDSGIPFTPVERTEVFELLSSSDARLVQQGEASLYKGNAIEAEQLFSSVTHDNPKIRSLILTRRGESRYLLAKYREALDDFVAAEKIYPDIISLNPTAFFAYGDCIARLGNPERGREMLAALIARNAEKPYARILLVRLGDILMRGGREPEAAAVYRNVMTFFPDSPAAFQARMKLADRRLLSVDSTSYPALLAEYREIQERGGDFTLRENAAFKEILLLSLYGAAEEGTARIDEFLKRHPRSAYVPVAESMQYDLVTELLTELVGKGDHEGVVRAVEQYRNHLAKAVQQGDLLRGIDAAYGHLSRIRERLALFSSMAERRLGGEQAPFILRRVVDDAMDLGEEQLAEKTVAAYLERFPKDGGANGVRELLAGLRFGRVKPVEIVRLLTPFGEGKNPPSPTRPQTLWLLGKSLLETGEPRKAAAVLERYLSHLTLPAGSPLAREAAYDLSRAYEMIGSPAKGGAVISRAKDDIPPEMEERFRYRSALLKLKEGKRNEAERMLKEIAEKGKDPLWRSAALQQLMSDEVAIQIQEARRLLSKK